MLKQFVILSWHFKMMWWFFVFKRRSIFGSKSTEKTLYGKMPSETNNVNLQHKISFHFSKYIHYFASFEFLCKSFMNTIDISYCWVASFLNKGIFSRYALNGIDRRVFFPGIFRFPVDFDCSVNNSLCIYTYNTDVHFAYENITGQGFGNTACLLSSATLHVSHL